MPDNQYGLTSAELRVLILVGNGLTTTEIAGRLGLSVQTVKNQLWSAYKRLGVSNRWGAMVKMGWLIAPHL